jgi:hypothetical protein
MSVKLKTPSNGSVTLAPEDTGSDVVLTVPAVAGEVVNDVTLRTELNATGSAPIFACRAWVNFDGTGTVAIRESGNVSSITDNGTGDYTVNFTTAMPDADYSKCVAASPSYGVQITTVMTDAQSSGLAEVAPTTSAFRFLVAISSTTARTDAKYVSVAIFR